MSTYRVTSANLYTYNKQAAAALDSIAAKQGDDGRWVTVLTEAHRFGKGEGSGMIGRRLGGTEYGLPWDGRRENRGRSEVKVVVGPGVKVKSNDVFQLSDRVTGSKAADKFWHDRWAVEVVTEDGWVFIGYHGNAVVVSKVTGKPLDNPGARQSAKGMGVLEARVRKHVQAGRKVVVAGDGNVSQRSKWHAAPGVALTEAGLSDQRFHRVDFTATNAQIRQHNTFNVPGADHEGMWADIRNTQGGDMGAKDYRRADATAQWFADDYPGSSIKPNVLVLHTTEGASWPDYSGGASAPTYTAMPQGDGLSWRQHFPETMSARALRNEAGGVETNTLNCIQVELVGTCAPGTRDAWVKAGKRQGVDFVYWPEASDALLQSLAHFIADLHKRRGLKLQAPKFLAYPASYGASPVRFSFAQWRRFYGICGHQHVPENSHGDPGALNIEKVLRYAVALAYPKAKGTRLEKQREVIEGALVELDKASPKRSRLHDMVAAIRAALKKGPTK